MPASSHQIPTSTPYAWPHSASLSRSNTALVLVDMQRDFCEPDGYLSHQGLSIAPTRAIIPALQRLLHAFRRAGFQVYHTREGHRPDLSTLTPREAFRSRNNASGLGVGEAGPLGRLLVRGEPGHDIVAELYPVAGEPVVDKPGRSAFAYTDFELLLRNRGITNLVIGGVTADVCVGSTLREANDRGFDCLLLRDGCAAVEEGLHEATVRGVEIEGGVFGAVAGVEDVLRVLEGHVE